MAPFESQAVAPQRKAWGLSALRLRVSSLEWAPLTRNDWLETGAFVAVFALAAAVRLVRLGTIPRIVTADEADNLQTAYHIIAGTGPGIFGFDWKPGPALSLYPLAWSIEVFGNSIADFRMFVVILSLLTIILFYLLARQSMRAPAALAAVVLLATNLWFLHFSRTAWDNVNASLFAVGACWATMRALKTQRLSWWVIAGLFVTLGFYGYFTARFIFVAVALIAILAVALRQAPWRSTAMGLAVAGVVSAVLFAPMAKNIIEDWDFFNRRAQSVSVFNTNDPYEGDTNSWVIVAKNVGRNYRGFILQDGSEVGRGLWGRYNPANRTPLDSVSSHLFWAGLVVAAIRWRKSYPWWTFLAPLFIAEVFSRGTPDLARGVIFAPFYFLFIGMLFDEVLQRFQRPIARTISVLGIAAVVAFVAATNVSDYFDWQDDPVTQHFRLPGLALCEFDGWRGLAQEAASRGPGGASPAEFEALRRELNCSPEIREWFQLPEPGARAP